MEEDIKLGNTIQEFEEIFGNVPIKDLDKIRQYIKDNYIPKLKVREKIEEFKTVRNEILKNENELNRKMITYDLVRNDYCEKMLQELLED